MCTICNLTQTFDPTRHEADSPISASGTPSYANFSESADAAANTNTAYSIQVGDTFNGTLGSAGDRDWVEVTLQAGETYQIDLTGNTLSDPLLRLYDSNGNLVAENDDSGGTYDSQVTFTASGGGTYYVAAGAWNDQGSGSYTVAVSTTAAPENASYDELADFLTDGYWNQRSFDTSQDNRLTVNLTALNAEGQQLARWALEAWEMVADLEFVEVTGNADITFDDDQPGAFAGSSYMGDTITSSNVNVSSSWVDTYGATIDSYAMSAYMHEIGHALGLGHQGNYNGNASYGTHETFANDSWQVSVMSYFSQSDNTATNASYAEVVTPMMADIIAIQSLYGAPGSSSPTAGNTTWGQGSTLGNYLDQVFDYLDDGSNPDVDGSPMAFTLYDQGGTDWIDLSYSGRGDTIDLRGGTFSNVGGLIGNVGIARGTVIENLITGSGHDVVTGNSVGNVISTNDGNDSVDAGAGWDVLWGGSGNDTLSGEGGNDTLYGGGWNDVLDGGIGEDYLRGDNGHDTLRGGAGNDILGGRMHNDRLVGGDGNDGLWGGDGNDILQGGADNDTMGGGDDADLLQGGGGNDDLRGGGGADTLEGGSGHDVLYGGWNSNVLDGGSGSDTIVGGIGDDTFIGGAGNDVMYGGWGDDTLSGGFGEDRFVFGGDFGHDVIEDFSLSENDVLALDDALWANSHGALSAQQVVSTFGSDVGNDLVLTFGSETITLEGHAQTGNQALAGQIEIF